MPKAATARWVALGLCALLCACGTPAPKPRPAPPPSGAPANVPKGAPPNAAEPVPPGNLYRIDTRRTELEVLVYRSGPMAALGHNHVLANRSVAGWARWNGAASDAAFELSFPASAFSIDEPALRARAGADFAEEVDEQARSGTRTNMLGDAVLAAAAHPSIRVQSERIESSGEGLRAAVRIEVAGHVSHQVVPFTLAATNGNLQAHVRLDLSQSALGLTPLSIFLGALRVDDVLRVELEIAAVPAAG